MQKAIKVFSAIVGRVLFIGFSIQIILGICWMVGNFAGFQQFGESLLYEEISQTLICDEYEGILYPVLILIAKGIEALVPIPYRFFLYLLQIGFAFLASVKTLESIGIKEKFWRVWGELVLLTFPMAMQCHLAVLPDSFMSSCVLLELAFGIRILRSGQTLSLREFAKVLGCWLAASLLQPVFVYIGAVPVAVLSLYVFMKSLSKDAQGKSDKKKFLYATVLVFAFSGMIAGVNSLTQEDGYYGRVHQSLNFALASRCAWSYVQNYYDSWPEEVKANISWEQATQTAYYADNMDRVLGRTLEANLGVERAEELLGEMAATAWQLKKGEILHDTAWDLVGYTFSPLVIQRQFSGKAYDSYSGRNYDIMRSETPLLTKYYMDYSCLWFAAGLVITLLLQAVWVIGHFIKRYRTGQGALQNIAAVLMVLGTSGMLVLLYALRGAGMMDYKKSVVVTLLWILWMVYACKVSVSAKEEM